MERPSIKKIVCLSWIRQLAKAEFEALKSNSELDTEFFNGDELEHYIDVLLKNHEADWLVIDDWNEGAF